MGYIRVGHDSRGLAISNDGKYIMAGNYLPTNAVLLDAETLEKVAEISGVTTPTGVFNTARRHGQPGY